MTSERANSAAPPASRRRGGRPTRDAAALLGEKIITVATDRFLRDGFGATSIAAVATQCGISKRTFYHRFRDKPELFRAVIGRLIARWLPPFDAGLSGGAPLQETLKRVARQMLNAGLSPEALALYRMLIAEAPHFPEIAQIMQEQGAAAGVERIARLLASETAAGRLHCDDPAFAAEQFLNMVLAAPRRRALGIGAKLTEAELDAWSERTVALFLDGCRRTEP